MDIVLHKKLLQLQAENAQLREQLEQLKQEAYMNEGRFLDAAKGVASAVQSGIQGAAGAVGKGLTKVVRPAIGLQTRVGRAVAGGVKNIVDRSIQGAVTRHLGSSGPISQKQREQAYNSSVRRDPTLTGDARREEDQMINAIKTGSRRP